MIDYEKISEKIFSIIKGQNYPLVMFTKEGHETSIPTDARRFFCKEPNFMVTLDDTSNDIKFNKNKNIKLEEIEKLLKQIKNLAKTYMLKSTVKIFGQEIMPKDYAYQAKQYKEKMNNPVVEDQEVDVWMVHVPANVYDGKYYDFSTVHIKVPMDIAHTEKDAINYVNANQDAVLADIDRKRAARGKRYVKAPVEQNVFFKSTYHVSPSKVLVSEASLSKLHGTRKTSYQTLESVKVIVRHRKPVDEEVRGSRTRAIKEIFIERADERFKFPYNYLSGARAMARHVYEGGKVDDAVGNYIIEQTGNLLKLKEFYRYATSNKLINEGSEDIIGVVKESAARIKNELHKLQGVKTYEATKAKIQEQTTEIIEEQNADDLKELFTIKTFDEGIGAVLPLVKKLVNEKTAWRQRIEEASSKPFVIVRSQIISEDEIFEFTNPQQKIGYRLQGIVSRVQEESELSKFISNAADKLIEGQELSAFEKTIVKNTLNNITVVESYGKDPQGPRPKVDRNGKFVKPKRPYTQDEKDDIGDREYQYRKENPKNEGITESDDDDDDGTGGKFRDEWGRDTAEQDEWKKNVTGKKNKKADEKTVAEGTDDPDMLALRADYMRGAKEWRDAKVKNPANKKKSLKKSLKSTLAWHYDKGARAGEKPNLPEATIEGWDGPNNDSVEAVRNATTRRIATQHVDLISKYGVEKVMDAIDMVAEFYGSGGLEEIGSSDISAFVNSVKRHLMDYNEPDVVDKMAEGLDQSLSRFTDLNEIFSKKKELNKDISVKVGREYPARSDGATDIVVDYTLYQNGKEIGSFWNSEYYSKLTGNIRGKQFEIEYDYKIEDPYSEAGVLNILRKNGINF